MNADADAIVIGAGPAGSATAILLAAAGWRVALIEQHAFPRQKVCGECIAPSGLEILDRLGVGVAVHRIAGPELRHLAWMSGEKTVHADLPACRTGAHRYGRALGRDRLDTLLVGRARSLGVRVLQPARVEAVHGEPGNHQCIVQCLQPQSRSYPHSATAAAPLQLRAPVVIDAHGAWEAAPRGLQDTASRHRDARRPASDLLAFKASFHDTRLPPGLLPVLSLPGGCGGIVIADDRRATLACCLDREALRRCRAESPQSPAGVAIERWLRRHCAGVDRALSGARRDGDWLAVGPVRPGRRPTGLSGPFAVGNAAGETHPLIGEGIAIALQSAAMLAQLLVAHAPAALGPGSAAGVKRDYTRSWRRAFLWRQRLASTFAGIAMRPAFGTTAGRLLARWPGLLTAGSSLAGKAHRAVDTQRWIGERP